MRRLSLHVQTGNGGAGGANAGLRPAAWATTELSLAMTAALLWAIVLPLEVAVQLYGSS